MAVKIHCSVCDKFLKDIPTKGIGAITGKEICKECGGRIDGLLAALEKDVEKFRRLLTDRYDEMTLAYRTLTSSREKFESDIKGVLLTMSVELNKRKEDLLGG